MNFDHIKDRKMRAALPKRVDVQIIPRYTFVKNLNKNLLKNEAHRAHTNHPKEYGHLTYRRRNIEGSTTTSYRCVEYTQDTSPYQI